ncbi:MAG: adenosylcobinamide-GDP ribazoletransferase [Geobacter sp.]|nr:adenosylcobinamide-GDP ribazoletransferase [Geobacter sp.]
MRLYFVALQFLTIIPLPFSVRCDERDMGRSMTFFPLVGLTLGVMLAGADWLFSARLPREVGDLLLIVLLSVLTGALHLDGLADVCDGIAARGGRERFLEVMKDSRIGAVGVVGLVLGLLLKYQVLHYIPIEYKRHALFFFPMLARFSQVQVAVNAASAREKGLGVLFAAEAGMLQLAVAGGFTLAAAFLLFGVTGVYVAFILYLLTWGLKAWFHKRLGGITGDVIGCVSELNEIGCMLILLILLGNK